MALIQGGNNTGNVANVDANFDLMTTTPQVNTRNGGAVGTPNYVGAARLFCEKDSGSLTGTAYLASPMVSEDDLLQVGLSTPLFDYSFNATAQDTASWYYAFSTMAVTQSGGFLVFNSNNTNTTTTGCYMQTKRYFNLTGNAGLHVEFIGTITSAALSGEVFLSGLGIPVSVTAQPTDGVWFNLTSAGLIGVMAFNGTITTTAALPIGGTPLTITPNSNANFKIIVDDRVVEFWINGIFLGEINTPSGNATPFMSNALPIFQQYYNTSAVTGTTMQVKVGTIHLDQLDSNLGKSYPQVQASKGLMGYQGTPGGTIGTTALYSNSLTPGAGLAMTNTTAALGVGLGGQFTWQPTLVVGTDGILCSYQVPVGTVSLTGRTLYVTGVRIQSSVYTALVGGPVVEAYSLAFGHTAVSMATAETGSFVSASTKAPRRIPLGIETFPATAVVGTASNNAVFMPFASPIVVNPGEFIAIAAKNIGVVTTAGVITTLVTFDAFWE